MKYETDPEIREKIDSILYQMTIIQSNQGTDSSKTETKQAIKQQERLLSEIKQLDAEFYKTIVPDSAKT